MPFALLFFRLRWQYQRIARTWELHPSDRQFMVAIGHILSTLRAWTASRDAWLA
jgi:hypothetical protein